MLTGATPVATGGNAGATVEPGEPLTTSWGDIVGATLWYRWTAPVTASYVVEHGRQ